MKVLFEFEYDDKKLGRGWFNIFNLELSLFSEKHTRKELLKVKEIKDVKDRIPSIGDMYNCFEVVWKRNCKIFRKGTNQENVDYSYAVAQEIHKLVKDKLK